MSVRRLTLLLTAIVACAAVSTASAGNSRVGVHVLYLEPSGSDTRDTSDNAWGGNIDVVLVTPGTWDALAFNAGLDIMQLDSHTQKFIQKSTGLRTENQTRQDLIRLFLGARLGHQGHGFLRPYVAGNLAVNFFNISTDLVIPDDSAEDNDIRQSIRSDTETSFGFDAALGLELNFSDKWYIDVGGKFIKTFDVPAQLGDDAVEIHPQYIQVYVGAGITFGLMGASSDE